MTCWMARSLTGMRLFNFGSTMPNQAEWLDAPQSFPAWDLAHAANLPVCLQMTMKALPQLLNLRKRFPRVRVIVDHLCVEDGPLITHERRSRVL